MRTTSHTNCTLLHDAMMNRSPCRACMESDFDWERPSSTRLWMAITHATHPTAGIHAPTDTKSSVAGSRIMIHSSTMPPEHTCSCTRGIFTVRPKGRAKR